MSIASILWKNLKKCIFIEEFDDIYEDKTTATIFGLFCCSGGFSFHTDVQPRFRKFWIYFNVLNFIIINVSCLFYLFNAPREDYFDWLLPLHVMPSTLGKYGIYYWIYSTPDLFSKLMETIDDNERKYEKYLSFCTLRLNKSGMIKVKISSCILVFCLLSYNLEYFVKCENYVINFYPMYFPFPSNSLLRISIRFIQGVTLVPEFLSFVAFPSLIFITTRNIYNRFELLGVFLRDTSYSVRLSIDEVSNLEMAMDEQRIPNSLTKFREMNIRKALALDELVRKIIIVTERHRELYCIAKSSAEKLEYICYTIASGVFMLTVIHAFFISSITNSAHLHRILIFIATMLGLFLYWLVFCFVGELFQNMNEIIATEMYEIPWYHLKPKDRRLVHTFLTIIQRPISIVICKIYPVNLALYPDMLNTAYSNMQRLQTLQSRNRNS